VTENMKSERVRRIFAETAREMIMTEGIESVSVRKIAEKAGYTQGTVYNHFASMDEILWYARSLMIEDLGAWMMQNTPFPVSDAAGLKGVFLSYLDYFIDRPRVYRFFYFHALDRNAKTKESPADAPGFAQQVMGTFDFITKSGRYSAAEIKIIADIMIFSIQGMLTLLVSGNDGTSADSVRKLVSDTLDFLLRDIDAQKHGHTKKGG